MFTFLHAHKFRLYYLVTIASYQITDHDYHFKCGNDMIINIAISQ